MQSRINSLLNYSYTVTDIHSIELQLFLLTVKCLMPYEDKIGCFFNVKRYYKEMELFAYYKNGMDETIEHWLERKIPTDKKDGLMEFKIIPIALVNTLWDNLVEEILKAVTFYTLNIETILDGIIVSSGIYEYMNNNLENVHELTKERLIGFSVKEFIIKNNINVDKSYIIDFEKERIKTIQRNDFFNLNRYKSIQYIFGEPNKESSEGTLIDSYSAYLYKLRKGRIDPEKLKIPDKMPDLKECLKKSYFNHPLLGKCKVEKRANNEVVVRNKSGLMRIRI